MDILKAFTITLASGVFFALFGGGVGFALGTWMPDYYRTVFRVPQGAPMNAAQTGVGLGLSQGLGAGLLIGLVIVVTAAWYNARRLQHGQVD